MAAKQTYPSLDHTGTQAAVYPSEAALWVQGPPITDPGDPIAYANDDLSGPPPGPWANPAVEEAWLNEVINGETPNEAYWESVVNNAVYGPQGVGDWNVQPYQSGHSQIVQANPASEQGWGVGPARRWAHYPKVESPNPARNEGQHLRNGQLPWVAADSTLYERSQLAWQQQWNPYKFRSPVSPVVPVPPSVPFGQTVPTYAGGPEPYPGLDIPLEAGGVYNWP
jgi:hypothetical protein